MKNVLIDTSIVLDGVENVTMLDKQNNVFVSDVVLRELDGNKGAEGSKGYNAREFFRQFNKNDFKTLDTLPETGMPVMKNDTLTEGSIDSGAHVYTLSRKWYRAKDINDSRIIEIAKDYNLGLVTLDQAQSARAKSNGVEAGHPIKSGDSPGDWVAVIAFVVVMPITVFIYNTSIAASLVFFAFAMVCCYFALKLIHQHVEYNPTISIGNVAKSSGQEDDIKAGTSYVEYKMIEGHGSI